MEKNFGGGRTLISGGGFLANPNVAGGAHHAPNRVAFNRAVGNRLWGLSAGDPKSLGPPPPVG